MDLNDKTERNSPEANTAFRCGHKISDITDEQQYDYYC